MLGWYFREQWIIHNKLIHLQAPGVQLIKQRKQNTQNLVIYFTIQLAVGEEAKAGPRVQFMKLFLILVHLLKTNLLDFCSKIQFVKV